MTAMLRCDPTEPPDDGGLRICRAEPSVNASSCSANNGANSSASSTSGSFTGIAVANPRDPTQIFTFPFTSCYDADATQEIFNTDVHPLIDVAWSGITVTIFAYGVTSSGKTHTMQGPPNDPGVIPRVVEVRLRFLGSYFLSGCMDEAGGLCPNFISRNSFSASASCTPLPA
ncbi:P-loop containing nucleoside triphosphate hydrolase protein [Mycena albidolilacea]|uniref:P-loop containing nucleoside triphosphate hydrolase protein n=1 Tax=Mycena albidolilacea TaxID=1033008 RepID=A0AAD7F1L0_9AGAR|nr:P-loop containing nucleoside triphosphate hydrolase protein [Mycena albidolilacea]